MHLLQAHSHSAAGDRREGIKSWLNQIPALPKKQGRDFYTNKKEMFFSLSLVKANPIK